ncbi:MAG: hypothetical protein EBW87_04675 [Burkholderiaceae bacterium]|nr:hypothetical protein [Burkholderiaceae bacterium]
MQAGDAAGCLEVTRLEVRAGDSGAQGDVRNGDIEAEVHDANPSPGNLVLAGGEVALSGLLDGLERRTRAVDVGQMTLPGIGLELMGLAVEQAVAVQLIGAGGCVAGIGEVEFLPDLLDSVPALRARVVLCRLRLGGV